MKYRAVRPVILSAAVQYFRTGETQEPTTPTSLLLDFSQRPYHNKGNSELLESSIGFSGFSVVF